MELVFLRVTGASARASSVSFFNRFQEFSRPDEKITAEANLTANFRLSPDCYT
jgi:hypothetical protein